MKDREWIELVEKSTIENEIHKENELKCMQTNSTPVIIEQLVSDLGFLRNIESCDRILAGTY